MHKGLRWAAAAGIVLALAGCSANDSGSSESAAMPMSADTKQAAPNQGAPKKEATDSAGSGKAPRPRGSRGSPTASWCARRAWSSPPRTSPT
ncbi:hypothetical protein MJQ72_39360 [Amycolatopsis sp. EV170708-02-1]|nr:hypothetical protein [Amycolatopsis sp. EV170708-02-1]UMP02385.1 hypothetical protein MJQ72_39360 [Amycolatopsis sp. EV170708-02-1]